MCIRDRRKLGLVRPIDLALHLPLRYEDETRIVRLRDARDGETVQIEATVTACDVTFRPRRQLLVTVDDGSDSCTLRFFNFYPSQQKALAVGNRIRVRGEVRGGFVGRTMLHPAFRAAGGELPDALTPVYPTAAGLPQPYLRRAVAQALTSADLTDTLPPAVPLPPGVERSWDLRRALGFLHHPAPDVSLAALEDRSHPAWQRLKAEELLAQQLSQLTARRERALQQAPALALPQAAGAGSLHARLLAVLPFALTSAQQRVCGEIAADLSRSVPMHRLLQGDVGSGKTVVAALAATIAIDAGWQCALMAPTEILAEQHFRKLIGWLEPLGLRVAWLTGSQKKKERTAMLALIASGEAALVVGTHAVIQEQVKFRRLALAIIDEQHRFGVAQRLALRSKMGEAALAAEAADSAQSPAEPHLLMMSATPIPRTLAMSYYADLDVSTLDELPPGRTPIVTRVVSDARREEVIERIRAQVAAGRQVYWVCPLIEESEALDLRNATETHAELSAALNSPHAPPLRGSLALQAAEPSQPAPLRAVQPCAGRPGAAALSPEGAAPALGRPGDGGPPGAAPPVRVGLLHSRMSVAEKKAVMAQFADAQAANRLAVLVATTVIEVGVDVPNASLMVIEHAERFGLSQLHQLRGRVGRGAAASACVLLYGAAPGERLGQTARERLKAMQETADGFEIARRDLEIRGPGEFLGARQSGAALLRFADLATDAALLDWARQTAPVLLDRHPEWAGRHVARWLGGKSDYLKA
ncbi:MAG: ATP-dependent DNA helicase RecG [Burkholderiaceae bacterium]|nr:ATP-dependent DNA helicase RecG [Burkholderiaceae bacterium]